jgi:hypothetical protein
MTKVFVPDWYDPPEGWRYGFPKTWPVGLERSDETLAAQLKADGYPEHAIPVAVGHTRFGGHFNVTGTYEEWSKEVDRILEKRTGGLDQSMLPDWLSRDSYECGMTPEEGAALCLHSAGWEDDDERIVDEL